MLALLGFKLPGILNAKMLSLLVLKKTAIILGLNDRKKLMEKENLIAIKEECRGFLMAHKLAVISTASKDGALASATMMYFFDEDWNFYFITRQRTRKFKNLMENPNISMVVGTELAPGTVQINGRAEWLKEEGLEFVGKITLDKDLKDLYYGSFLMLEGDDFAVMKVRIDWMRYLHLDLATKKENYYQIIG